MERWSAHARAPRELRVGSRSTTAGCRSAAGSVAPTIACRTRSGTPNISISPASQSRPLWPAMRRCGQSSALAVITSMPYDFPRPTGLTGGLNQAWRPHHRPRPGARRRSRFQEQCISTTGSWACSGPSGGRLPSKPTTSAHVARNAYRKFDINRFNGDMLRRAIRPHPAGLFEHQLHRVHGPKHVPWRHGGHQGQSHGATKSGRHIRSARRPTIPARFRRPGRPDAYGPPDQDKGPADFDVRQKFVMSANWILPSPASGLARALGGGWQIAGTLLRQTGTPFSVVCIKSRVHRRP